MTPAAVDAWTATMSRRTDAIRAAMFDLIDCGPDNTYPTPRNPTKREQVSQDRPDGHFHPTPPGHTRSAHEVSNPVLGAITSHETTVEEAVTNLIGTVGEVASVLMALGIQPYDEQGRTLIPPKEPPTRKTPSGRIVIEQAPSHCRRTVQDCTSWLRSACDALADRMRLSDDAQERGQYVERLLHLLARRVGVVEPRTCKTGCGREAPVGRGETCTACRSKASYERKAS